MQKILRSYHQVSEAKSYSRSNLPKELSNIVTQKITEDVRKEKSCSGVQKLKDQLPFAWRLTKMTLHHRLSQKTPKSLRTTFSKNAVRELLLMFQLFKQFDFKTRCFILKIFSHIIFKNGYFFLHFLRGCMNVLPQYGASDWNYVFTLISLKWRHIVVGHGEISRILMSWFMELVLKYFRCCLSFDLVHKDKVI